MISLFFGCWLQTALGFGMAVVAAPIIVIFKPEWVPVVLSINALALSILNTLSQKRHLELNKMYSAFIWRIPGTFIGAWLLIQISTASLQLFVASSVIFAVAISLVGKQFDYTPRRLGIAAFVSGIVGTTSSIGGPPMAMVMQHGKPDSVRANLSIYFTYSCIISLISYGYLGLLTPELIMESISFLPFSLLGFFLGVRSRNFVSGKHFRYLTLILCSCAAIFALGSALVSH